MLLNFSYLKTFIDNVSVHPQYFTSTQKWNTNANKIQNQTLDYKYAAILLKLTVKIQALSTRWLFIDRGQ